MPRQRLAQASFWLSMTACLTVGALTAIAELIAGTRLDTLAERLAGRS